MTPNQKSILERFLQYGDLQNADLLFVGMEEGLGRETVKDAINSRIQLYSNPIFRGVKVTMANYCWYITDSRCLTQAYQLVQGNALTPLNLITHNYGIVMQMQSRMHWLLQGNNRTNNYHNMPKSFTQYAGLHNPNSKTAMIDIYPFPKRSANNWPNDYKFINNGKQNNNLFTKPKDYYNAYSPCNSGNPREKCIENLYNTCPLPLTICYAGISGGKFKLECFYNSLGFTFGKILTTNNIPAQYTGPIRPINNHGKPFKIGVRKLTIENRVISQRVVLTPFFTTRQNPPLLMNDIDVISTWI